MQEDYLRMKKEEVANAQKMRECGIPPTAHA